MARVVTYVNFARSTEEAFRHYQTIFGGDFTPPGIMRMRDVPMPPEAPALPEADLDLIVHIELPLLGGHVLMGTDAPESMGFSLTFGNNVHIQLEPDTRAESERLFSQLSEGGTVKVPLQDMFWGAYFGSCIDKFGLSWMINCRAK